jgi:hypothetical protein
MKLSPMRRGAWRREAFARCEAVNGGSGGVRLVCGGYKMSKFERLLMAGSHELPALRPLAATTRVPLRLGNEDHQVRYAPKTATRIAKTSRR